MHQTRIGKLYPIQPEEPVPNQPAFLKALPDNEFQHVAANPVLRTWARLGRSASCAEMFSDVFAQVRGSCAEYQASQA
jgi:hypothetical protein